MHSLASAPSVLLLLSLVAASPALAGYGPNSGGKPESNGCTHDVGPETPAVLWSVGRSSIITWQPVRENRRVSVVRSCASHTSLERGVVMDRGWQGG
ncbi:MAG: hypothetical protein HZA53_00865 [Planctomycetes bacterium]|nr:hypothetical protein [Planctomycetota bacterium]